ncbi:hypothetical protein [Yersinia massiliensis]|uniref:hypothetical protein n=1 Tax=Yersinia TaxID=629 RepID=UPI001CFF03FB|nr:hypothetical protein [Yersinia massiliensis]EKN3564684.1 hypothetical protein [Yersinia enterocolitica]EKN4887364.1 hypothetical protein [Yersinia enterocolitica]EKN4888735.1 hypothetical protein [Yersinia enterocolitica]EKN4901204.1 hypothetical protein [Yersinia enterocolitica]MCB5319113.1 hypothetical protein [Yersinia massiliensis]
MEWRGIPFPETVERIVTNTSLAIDKIPKVYIDTGDNTWSVTATMIATILGSLIAGSIPAAIAWRTIKKNQESVEKDRVAQQASFDKDREAQLLIATRSFNAQVLSNNRQAWINELRNIIADFISSINLYITASHDLKVATDSYENYKKYYDSREEKTESLLKGMDEFSARWSICRSERDKYDQVLKTITTKTSLMLNPREDSYNRIITLMTDLYQLPSRTFNSENYDMSAMYESIYTMSASLIKHVQECLKAEWERVKAGE